MQEWDSRTYVFNYGCGQCHATDYDVGHELRDDGQSVYRSTFLEGAVACESCHGPGSIHTAWHRRDEHALQEPGLPVLDDRDRREHRREEHDHR